MLNVTFYIDKSNTDREGFAPIKARIIVDSREITKTISKVKPKDWNDSKIDPKSNRQKRNKQRVKPPETNGKDNGFEEINTLLDNFQADSKKYFKECKDKNIEECYQNGV